MKIGFIGLGKMGFNMVQRLINNGHEVMVWDRTSEAIKEAEKKGAIIALSIEESFAMKVLAALRNQFGGHAVKSKN